MDTKIPTDSFSRPAILNPYSRSFFDSLIPQMTRISGKKRPAFARCYSESVREQAAWQARIDTNVRCSRNKVLIADYAD